MPSLEARFLASLTIIASLFILSVSAQHHHYRHRNRFIRPKLPVNGSEFLPGNNANTSPATLPIKISTPIKPRGLLLPRFPSREFLIAHNKVRVSLGQPPLRWDTKLARYARRWASKRVVDCKMIHSFGPYGENIFWGGRDHWTPTDVVRSWADECKYFHKDSNDCDQGQMCGHYTQVVWKDTLRVGCFRVKCNSGGVFVICSYDPPGNFVNESPFGTANNPPSPTPTTPSPPSSVSPVQPGPPPPLATTSS